MQSNDDLSIDQGIYITPKENIKWIHDLRIGDRLEVFHKWGYERHTNLSSTSEERHRGCWFIHELIEKDFNQNLLRVRDQRLYSQGMKQLSMQSIDIAPFRTYSITETKLSTPNMELNWGYMIDVSKAVVFFDKSINEHCFLLIHNSHILKYYPSSDQYTTYCSLDIPLNETHNHMIQVDIDNQTLWIFWKQQSKLTLFNMETKQYKFYIFNKSPATESWFWNAVTDGVNSLTKYFTNAEDINDAHYNYWEHNTNNEYNFVNIDKCDNGNFGFCRVIFVSAPFHQFHIIQSLPVDDELKAKEITVRHIIFDIRRNQWKLHYLNISQFTGLTFGEGIVYVPKLHILLLFYGTNKIRVLQFKIQKQYNTIPQWQCLEGELLTRSVMGENTYPMRHNALGFDYIIFSLDGNYGMWCYDALITQKWYKIVKTFCYYSCASTSVISYANDAYLLTSPHGDWEWNHLKISLSELIPNDVLSLYHIYYKNVVMGYCRHYIDDNTIWILEQPTTSLICEYIISNSS